MQRRNERDDGEATQTSAEEVVAVLMIVGRH